MPTYTYSTIDDPSGRNTQAFGINSTGQIVGQYFSNMAVHGFLYSGGTYTTLDDPSANPITAATGINDAGQIVGSYTDSTGMDHGFLYSGGNYTTVDDPLADPGSLGTDADGINNAGEIVGSYQETQHGLVRHGFLYNPNSNVFPPYFTRDYPSASETLAHGINDAGQIVGFYFDSAGMEHGFLYNPSGGTYTTIDDPLAGPFGTVAYGINNAGQIVSGLMRTATTISMASSTAVASTPQSMFPWPPA
jgi:probable HAF family extracellular repeat protein